MNIYKLLTVVILLNLILGLSMTLGNVNITDVNNYDTTSINNELGIRQGSVTTMNEDESTVSVTQDVLSVGSGIKWTKIIKNMFINAIHSLTFNLDEYDNQLIKITLSLISWFILLINIFSIIKVVNFVKNKDTT